MKKVLLITYNYYPEIGSAANRMANMYALLRKKGYEVSVLTTEPNYPNRSLYSDYDIEQHPEFEKNVIRIKTRTQNYTGNMFKRLMFYFEMVARFIRHVATTKEKYDTVIISSPPIFLGIIAPLLKWKCKWKCIIDIRDLWPESLKGVGVFNSKVSMKLAYWLERWIFNAADEYIINSEAFQSYLDNHNFKKPTVFIPNGICAEEFTYRDSVEKQTKSKFTVIYTGNFGLAQDTGSFLDLAERFRNDDDIVFEMIGYGYYKDEILRRIKEENMANVQYLGAKTRPETMKSVASADCAYVCLTSKEVFDTVLPGKVIDYMAVGTPIVGYVSGYAKSTIEKAECGYVSGERRLDEIEQYIRTLKSQPKTAATLGNNGYNYANTMFNWEKNIEKVAEMLEGNR
ncbi:MAG: glycosyltransferase family 4 protein [Bacilli bacterium]